MIFQSLMRQLQFRLVALLIVGYCLFVFASGSLCIVIFSCLTLISVSCLHFGQNSGNFFNSVSSHIFSQVLFLQMGHNINSVLFDEKFIFSFCLLCNLLQKRLNYITNLNSTKFDSFHLEICKWQDKQVLLLQSIFR